jgi:hypothetical protein
MIYHRWLHGIAIKILQQKANAYPRNAPQRGQARSDDLGVTWNAGSEFTIEPDRCSQGSARHHGPDCKTKNGAAAPGRTVARCQVKRPRNYPLRL